MTIPNELKPYYRKVTPITKELLKSIIDKIGFDTYFEEQISSFINCTKILPGGIRPMMTSYGIYKDEISNTLEMIEELPSSENKAQYLTTLVKAHLDNLEFEANNPYDYKPTKVKRSNPRRKDNEQLTMEGLESKPKKETAAERKLKQTALKLNKLSFNLKPAQQ